MLKYITGIILLIACTHLRSQSDMLGYGFRAGMSFAKIDGPSEVGVNGENLETNKMSSGFHIGMAINFKLTDIMGLRTELLYSQRGTDYTYDGPSYYVLGPNTLTSVTLMGNRKQTINVSNSYIDIPLLAYYRIGYFEISGGLNTGILVASTAGGTLDFNGVSPIGTAIPPIQLNVNYDYKSDEAGYASAETKSVRIDGRDYPFPQFVGAYYEFPERGKTFYKTLDLGLSAGLAYFLNDGLYLSAKYIHGLGDVDRNEYDISLKELNPDGSHVFRSDNNKSRSWQFSIGFSF